MHGIRFRVGLPSPAANIGFPLAPETRASLAAPALFGRTEGCPGGRPVYLAYNAFINIIDEGPLFGGLRPHAG